MGVGAKVSRFLKGEPVYKPEDVSIEEQQGVANAAPNAEVKDVVPLLRVEKTECTSDETHLDVYGHVHNESEEAVTLEEIHLLDMTRQLDKKLSADDSKRLRLYVGPRPNHLSASEAIIKYRTSDKAYSAHYKIHTGHEEGKHIITALELQLPIHEA